MSNAHYTVRVMYTNGSTATFPGLELAEANALVDEMWASGGATHVVLVPPTA